VAVCGLGGWWCVVWVGSFSWEYFGTIDDPETLEIDANDLQ